MSLQLQIQFFFFFFKCGPFLKSLRNLLLSTTNWHFPRAPPSDWTTRAFAKCLCGDWTLCSCSCWPSATAGGVQGGVRRSVLQGIWWNRSFSSVQFSHSVMSNSSRPCGLQHARPPCPSSTPRACSNSCPSKWWCHSTISSSVVPFSLHLQSLPASGSFPMSQFFISGGQSIGVSASASVLPMNIQDWFPLGWTGWISLQSKGLSRVFSNTTV